MKESKNPYEDPKLIEEYDRWYDEYYHIFQSELSAIMEALRDLPNLRELNSIEIGVGTGRFAEALGIKYGLDPSEEALRIAGKRGIKTVKGIAEALPFPSKYFDLVFFITSLEFVSHPGKALKEAWRVLKSNGYLIIGLIDRDSWLGMFYLEKKDKSRFIKNARFFSVREILEMLKDDFEVEKVYQTLFEGILIRRIPDPVRESWGEGGFVVIRARKRGSDYD